MTAASEDAVRIRPAGAPDLRFLEELLLEAAYPSERARPSLADMLATPEIARYVAGWGRPGDAALVAEDSSGGLIGGAWYRLFAAAERGFGFIDSATPELSIAVVRTRRRQGIGSALLAALIRQARRDGYPALSLSVSPENPAASLYEQHGFVRVASHDEHWTMWLDLGSQSDSARGQ